MEKKLFGENMTMLQHYFGHELQPEIMRLYWNSLKRMTDLQFKNAVNYVTTQWEPTGQKPFPLIKHFIDGIAGTDSHSAAVNAIDLIKAAVVKIGNYESVDFRDPTAHAVIRAFGGWIEICNWTHEEWSMRRNQLIDTYISFLKTGTAMEGHMIGTVEARNRIDGREKFIKKPIPITRKHKEQDDVKSIGAILNEATKGDS